MDSRIGEYFLKAGPGFGGSCFKKDILNLIYICNHYGLNEVASYWEKVITINDWQQNRIIKIILEKLFGNISGKKISIFGFAFKANTNDTRESPAIKICKGLIDEGSFLSIYDPKVKINQIKKDLAIVPFNEKGSKEYNGNWEFAYSLDESVENSDAIIILSDWEEFCNLNYELLIKKMRRPSWIFDTRNTVNVNEAKKSGFNIWSLGNGNLT